MLIGINFFIIPTIHPQTLHYYSNRLPTYLNMYIYLARPNKKKYIKIFTIITLSHLYGN